MRAEVSQHGSSVHSLVFKIFIAAIAIRWLYAGSIFLMLGESGLMTSDSEGYLGFAKTLASGITSETIHGWEWLGRSPYMMPLFTWILTPHILLFGSLGPFAYVLTQGILDAATCVIVYFLAETIDRDLALPAAIAAAINPTQVVISGLLYTDTPFLFFVSLFLFGSARWLREPSWSAAITIGCGLGGAVGTRVLIAPWAVALPIFLLIIVTIQRRLRPVYITQLSAATLIFGLCTAPILMRNVMQYGSWSLTAQSGMHLNWYIVPLIKETRDGTPWATSFEEMERRTRERFGPRAENPFDESRRLQEIAIEELKQFTVFDVAKAWAIGAVINLGVPAIIISPPIATLPRTGFFATRGSSIFQKISNFVFRSSNALYAWCLILGSVGVIAMRTIQLIGFFFIARQRRNLEIVFIFIGWILFILVTNGPIASPKYRLPIEPVLIVFTGAGICALFRRDRNPTS